jgi:hypothetical protein
VSTRAPFAVGVVGKNRALTVFHSETNPLRRWEISLK